VIDRIVEGGEGEPDDAGITELSDDLRFEEIGGDQEQPLISAAALEVPQMLLQLMVSDRVGGGLHLEPIGEARRDPSVGDRAATTRRLIDERHHL
jgi:hypothetical protein